MSLDTDFNLEDLDERLISPDKITTLDSNDYVKIQENTIRPNLLRDYIGQESVKQQMQIFITAAASRQEPLDHSLMFGPPGLVARRRMITISNMHKREQTPQPTIATILRFIFSWSHACSACLGAVSAFRTILDCFCSKSYG